MQTSMRYSLNAVSVFAVAARLGSLKAAGLELSVTAGAVSHQIKILEESLGALLFERSNNSIELTGVGQAFYASIEPALTAIDAAVKEIHADAQHLTLRVPGSLAVRWLIPKLDAFKQRHPKARISLETSYHPDTVLSAGIDIAIAYRQHDVIDPTGQLLLKDYCQPLAKPELLKKYSYQSIADLKHIPILGSTTDNWDWSLWAEQLELDKASVRITDHFDTDDAVVHAALIGMGVTLMSSFLIRRERDLGMLVPLPDTKPIQLGAYYVLSSQKSNALKTEFERWLFEQAEEGVND